MQLDENTPLFVISVAAELANMHPQTLRQYDRMGLVSPTRTQGQSRRYTMADVAKLLEISRLSQEGVSLEGIRRVLELVTENQDLKKFDQLYSLMVIFFSSNYLNYHKEKLSELSNKINTKRFFFWIEMMKFKS